MTDTWLRALRLVPLLTLTLLATAPGCSQEIESPSVELKRLEPDLVCNAPEQFPRVVKLIGKDFTPMSYNVLDEARIELPTVTLTKGFNLENQAETGPPIVYSGLPGGTNASTLSWQSSEQMTLTFDADNIPQAGIYGVKVTQPDDSTSDELPIGLAILDPPVITELVPKKLCNAFQDETLTLVGTGFIQVGDDTPTVFISGGPTDGFVVPPEGMDGCVPITGLSESVQICKRATITVPGGTLEEGQHEVKLTNPDPVGCVTQTAAILEVIGNGPVLFYSDPEVVYNGINTRITLYMTAVTPPYTVEIVSSDDPGGARTPLASTQAGNLIQATVPEGTAPGTYDIIVTDAICSTRLEAGLVVTHQLTLTVTSIDPNFGYFDETVPVTINGDGFAQTPRAFLNPVGGDAAEVAIQLESVTQAPNQAAELTAVVPKIDLGSLNQKDYDLIVVNPSGEVGRLANAYTALRELPPVVADVVPQSFVNSAGGTITVQGTGFRGATVSLECVDPTGAPTTAPAVTTGTETCDPTTGQCTVTATIAGSGVPQGSICLVIVTNSDESFARFSAIGVTNSGFNLARPTAGPTMNLARRALVSAAAKATAAQRFVYAIGGDGGSGAPFSSVEFAPVSVFGRMDPWINNKESLIQERAFAGIAQVGRYVYVFGGTDGQNALTSAERALILSPEESPVITDLDLCLSGGDTACFDSTGPGIGAGKYSYRVSALIDQNDEVNLGGETLASDPIIVKLREFTTRKVVAKLTWSVPVDSLGVPLTGVIAWRIYRTPADGIPGADEQLLAEMPEPADPADRFYVDDGSATLDPNTTPLPLGSTSAWKALPNMNTARNGPAGAAAPDPATANQRYVYALLGKDNGTEAPGTGLTSYEYLPITLAPNARQTVAAAWETGDSNAAVGRWQLGAWVVDSVTATAVQAPDVYVYIGSGMLGNGTNNGTVEAGLVSAGGDLGVWDNTPGDFSNVRAGYGVAAAANRLFAFGGAAPSPRANAIAALIQTPPPTLAQNAWNNEGLSMTSERYLLGSSIQSAFIFLVGGVNAGGTVLNTTETVVW